MSSLPSVVGKLKNRLSLRDSGNGYHLCKTNPIQGKKKDDVAIDWEEAT